MSWRLAFEIIVVLGILWVVFVTRRTVAKATAAVSDAYKSVKRMGDDVRMMGGVVDKMEEVTAMLEARTSPKT